jgi:hypothetical protein
VLPFTPAAEQPHTTARVGCAVCDKVWEAVWPSRMPVGDLFCPYCRQKGGVAVVAILEA